MEIDRVGIFEKKGNCWEATPDLMNGAILSIETKNVSNEQVITAQDVCTNWSSKIEKAIQFIESVRTEYDLRAQKFNNPNAFINSNSEWSIYFDTESETESVVGVEFLNDTPLQLTIGD